MKDWRPHLDLARLSAALAEEILVASEQEVRDVSARTGRSLTGAARDVRRLIAAAIDEPDKRGAVLIEDAGAPCARQH
jgi:hypothetical protein